jgi:ubiquinone/menaquinone biosynthesis C-methylase UbiE
MVRAGEIEHGEILADRAEAVWNWSSPAGMRRAQRRADRLASAAGLRAGARVLELGCGTGLFTSMFAETGARVVAVDVSETLLRQAVSRGVSEETRFVVGDGENLPFLRERFEVVLGSSVLHHLHLSSALREIRRVLVPGGRLAFAEPNLVNPQIALQRSVPWLRELAGESPEETAFVRWSLKRELLRAGFGEVRIEPFDFLHPWTPGALIGVVGGMGRVLERVPVIREIAGSLLISARKPCG